MASSPETQREYYISQALTYFLGAGIIAQQSNPPYPNPFWQVIYITRFWVASALLIFVIFLFIAALRENLLHVRLANFVLRKMVLVPLLVFFAEFAARLSEMLKAGASTWFYIYYLFGLVLVLVAMVVLWYLSGSTQPAANKPTTQKS